jgi:hypothetical protein
MSKTRKPRKPVNEVSKIESPTEETPVIQEEPAVVTTQESDIELQPIVEDKASFIIEWIKENPRIAFWIMVAELVLVFIT